MREGWVLIKWSTLKLGNGASIEAKAIGSTSIDLYNHILLLDVVLYVPNSYKNVVSISSLTRNGYEFHFKRDICNIYFRSEMVDMVLGSFSKPW